MKGSTYIAGISMLCTCIMQGAALISKALLHAALLPQHSNPYAMKSTLINTIVDQKDDTLKNLIDKVERMEKLEL